MKIVINEGQFESIISESKTHISQLCSHYKDKSKFCETLETVIKKNLKDLRNASAKFFESVIKNPNYFNVITLGPGNHLYEERLLELIKFKRVLEKYKSCPVIIESISNDIKTLPKKGLKMNIDDNNEYSIINRLNTHYTAQAYLLTQLIIDDLQNKSEDLSKLNDLNRDEVAIILDKVLSKNYSDEVAKSLSELINTNEHFKKDLLGTLQRSRDLGNSFEDTVFQKLREKYGDDNVVVFSGDFGFVDYFGVDGVVIINGVLHPVQISTSMKTPKLFKYDSENCKTRGYYKSGNKIIMYEPI